jgi:hypothetical protein
MANFTTMQRGLAEATRRQIAALEKAKVAVHELVPEMWRRVVKDSRESSGSLTPKDSEIIALPDEIGWVPYRGSFAASVARYQKRAREFLNLLQQAWELARRDVISREG